MNKIAIYILFFLTATINSSAQICTGTLGNPVVNINFGGGANPGLQVPQIPAAYQYSNQDCPSEGSYALRTSTASCFNDWHNVQFDHTTNDPNGYFLLINTLPGTSEIYSDTIRGLCPNTTFEISTWMLNLLKPTGCSGNGTDPNVTFTVTDLAGSVLAKYNTGNIAETPQVAWIQYNFQFLSPFSGNVVLKMSNTGSGCGNDLAIDDITFRPCTGIMSAAFVNFPGSQIQTCNQQNYTLTATYNGFNNPSLQWQVSYDGLSWNNIAAATGNTYIRTPTMIGNYFYRFSVTENNNSSCRYYSNTVSIEVQSLPFAQATNYVFGCYGSPMAFYAAGGTSYEWTGPNGFNSNIQGPVIPKVDFSDAGMYIVKVSTGGGCFAYDTTNLVVYAAPVASVNPTQTFLCEDDSVQLVAKGSIRYKWYPSTALSNDTIANPIAKPKETTLYTVRVYNEYTCYDTANVKIVVWKKPLANAGPDKFTVKNKPVILEGTVSGTNINYSWSPANYLDHPLNERPKAAPPATATYILTVTSNNGCGIDIDSVKVEVLTKMFIPSAFTPNNDGLNDLWQVFTIEDYPKATVQVYNRWGQIVYLGKGFNYKPWDGMYNGLPLMSGTYVYIIDLGNNSKVLKGTVTIVR
jgi:gliding motility-associated-like protein